MLLTAAWWARVEPVRPSRGDEYAMGHDGKQPFCHRDVAYIDKWIGAVTIPYLFSSICIIALHEYKRIDVCLILFLGLSPPNPCELRTGRALLYTRASLAVSIRLNVKSDGLQWMTRESSCRVKKLGSGEALARCSSLCVPQRSIRMARQMHRTSVRHVYSSRTGD